MNLMIRRLIALCVTLLVVVAATGCAESSRPEASGKGRIRGINAIVTAPDVAFLIEERNLSSVPFKGSSGFNSYDNLSYNFNFDLFLPFEPAPFRLATRFINVEADQEYTVVLTGSIANPSTVIWEDPVREFDAAETVSEIGFAHLAPTLGELDVYFAAPGTAPVAGQAVGSFSNGNRLAGIDFEAATYELLVTPANDPATIIYQSIPIQLGARTRNLIGVFDPDPSVPGNVGVNFFNQGGASTLLGDINFPPQVRTLHAAFGIENFDGYFDSDFGTVIFPDIGFKELSSYADVSATITLLTLTPVGNSGATIHEADFAVSPGSRRTIVFAGEPGNPMILALLDDGRPLESFPLVRILNASFNTDALDVYVLDPGTAIDEDTIPPIRGIPSLVDTGFASFIGKTHELTVTLAGEPTPIAPPLILDLDNGDVIDVMIVDTVDPATLEIVVFDSQSLP